MVAKSTPSWVFLASASLLTVAMVTAFTDASSGARNFSATVVADSAAFLAISKNSNSVQRNFCQETSGQISCTFPHASDDAAGTGVQQNAWYEFDNIIRIANNGTLASANVDVIIGGTDVAQCTAALASGTVEAAQTSYSSNPSPVAVTKGGAGATPWAFLGLKFTVTEAAGQTVSCTFEVTAS